MHRITWKFAAYFLTAGLFATSTVVSAYGDTPPSPGVVRISDKSEKSEGAYGSGAPPAHVYHGHGGWHSHHAPRPIGRRGAPCPDCLDGTCVSADCGEIDIITFHDLFGWMCPAPARDFTGEHLSRFQEWYHCESVKHLARNKHTSDALMAGLFGRCHDCDRIGCRGGCHHHHTRVHHHEFGGPGYYHMKHGCVGGHCAPVRHHILGLCPTGCCGTGCPPIGKHHLVYAANPRYFDQRDSGLYAAQGYGVPVTVPLAPNVRQTYNYGWGIPSSRLTPISRPVPGTEIWRAHH